MRQLVILCVALSVLSGCETRTDPKIDRKSVVISGLLQIAVAQNPVDEAGVHAIFVAEGGAPLTRLTIEPAYNRRGQFVTIELVPEDCVTAAMIRDKTGAQPEPIWFPMHVSERNGPGRVESVSVGTQFQFWRPTHKSSLGMREKELDRCAVSFTIYRWPHD